jgi:hypothetical protein
MHQVIHSLQFALNVWFWVFPEAKAALEAAKKEAEREIIENTYKRNRKANRRQNVHHTTGEIRSVIVEIQSNRYIVEVALPSNRQIIAEQRKLPGEPSFKAERREPSGEP